MPPFSHHSQTLTPKELSTNQAADDIISMRLKVTIELPVMMLDFMTLSSRNVSVASGNFERSGTLKFPHCF